MGVCVYILHVVTSLVYVKYTYSVHARTYLSPGDSEERVWRNAMDDEEALPALEGDIFAMRQILSRLQVCACVSPAPPPPLLLPSSSSPLVLCGQGVCVCVYSKLGV